MLDTSAPLSQGLREERFSLSKSSRSFGRACNQHLTLSPSCYCCACKTSLCLCRCYQLVSGDLLRASASANMPRSRGGECLLSSAPAWGEAPLATAEWDILIAQDAPRPGPRGLCPHQQGRSQASLAGQHRELHHLPLHTTVSSHTGRLQLSSFQTTDPE